MDTSQGPAKFMENGKPTSSAQEIVTHLQLQDRQSCNISQEIDSFLMLGTCTSPHTSC